jgi:ubiquinol-cytochrome c reductase cytochrome c1 subunit
MRTLVLMVGILAGLAHVGASVSVAADSGVEVPPSQDWSFNGPFGRYDQAALRRGLLVYVEGCSVCHSLRHVPYRSLSALGVGFGPEDIRAFAAEFEVRDGPNEDGEMFMRPARPSDHFAPPFANKAEARRANRGMYPPDLSLIAKARKGGPNYLYALLVGYAEPPAGTVPIPGMYYNPYVSGHFTGMKAPLIDNLVEYDDGTEATVEQMAKDVTQFLAWAADPHMEERKRLGVKVVIFLTLLTVMFIALKLEVWAHLKKPSPKRENEVGQGGL